MSLLQELLPDVRLSETELRERMQQLLPCVVVELVERVSIGPQALREHRGRYSVELAEDDGTLAFGQAVIDGVMQAPRSVFLPEIAAARPRA